MRTDGLTDGHGKASNHFSLLRTPLKLIWNNKMRLGGLDSVGLSEERNQTQYFKKGWEILDQLGEDQLFTEVCAYWS